MEPRNHTPFPSLAFEGEAPDGQRFHVMVLRQTLDFGSGALEYADLQQPLCDVDTFFGEPNASGVRQESDLCHHKPRCDLIVNATAYAPGGTPARQFGVSFRLHRPDTPAPLPEPSHPLNPMMPLTDAQRAHDAAALQKALATTITGRTLVEKKLLVAGERWFRKRTLLARVVNPFANRWRLTAPAKFRTLTIRPDYAFGGQWRVNGFDNSHLPDMPGAARHGPELARRIPKVARLTEAQQAAHPDVAQPAAMQPVAHAAWETNPLGTGYLPAWCAKALRISRIAAPRITYAGHDITARHFGQAMHLPAKRAALPSSLMPAGLGVRPKTHPDRAALVGTVDDAFLASANWLPADFDFAVWNAAPPDQQCEWLCGDEVLVLTNLCAPETPGAMRDADGNTVLRLQLPRHDCFALVRLHSGEMYEQALHIDTVIVEPEERTVSLVWRITIAKDPAEPVRVGELRMRTFEERDALRAAIKALQPAVPPADGTWPVAPLEDVR